MPNFIRLPDSDIVQLRSATPADVLQMRQLEQQSPSAAHWTADQYDALFSPDAVSRVAVVATDPIEPSIRGFLIARCLPDEWEIENVVVAIDSRQSGIGAGLVRSLAQKASVSGARSIVLEVRESNLPALRLYENIGFKREGRRPAYYQSPREDALLFRLRLPTCDKIP